MTGVTTAAIYTAAAATAYSAYTSYESAKEQAAAVDRQTRQLASMSTPTADNSAALMDTAAQTAAASVSRGRTSTMLTGATGVDDAKNTSKVLLGQ